MRRDFRVVCTFGDAKRFIEALQRLNEAGQRDLRIYSPAGLPELERFAPRRGSPIRFFVLTAALIGTISGFALCIGSAFLYRLIVGGKQPDSWIPYCVIGFELTVLLGGITAFLSILGFAGLRPDSPRRDYRPEFDVDKFGVSVYCPRERMASVVSLLQSAGAERISEHGEPSDRSPSV